MANVGKSWNPEATPSSGHTPIPAGEYTMEIVESEYKATQGGNGMILKCKAQVVGGDFDGRPFYINYNLENANETAQDIGQRDFAGLRRATGVLAPDDSEELHFKPFRVKTAVQEKKVKVNGVKKGTGEMENVIKQYLFEREDGEPAPKPRNPGAKATDWRKAA